MYKYAYKYPSNLERIESSAVVPNDHKWHLISTLTDLTILNTNRVAEWRDADGKLAGANSFSSSDNSTRPFYSPGVVSPGGDQVINFNGGKSLQIPAETAERFIGGTEGQTIVIACGGLTADGDALFVKYEGVSGGRQFKFMTNNYHVSTDPDAVDADEVATYTRPAGSNILFGIWEPSVRTEVRLNNSLTPIGSATTPATTIGSVNKKTRIGALSNGNNTLNEGVIYEIIIYKRPITNAEQLDIYTVLANRWGI